MSLIVPPQKPVPDGLMRVHLSTGFTRDFPHDLIVFIREEMIGLRIVFREDDRRKVAFWPWAAIIETENLVTSDKYQDEYEAWKEFETVQAATEGRKPTFANEREMCVNCGTKAMHMIGEGHDD